MAHRVFVHIGAPKSGTTYLQSVLWNNRSQLAADGLLMPGRRIFDHELAVTAARHPRPRNAHQRNARATWQRLRAAITSFDGDAVLSNEWFVWTIRPQAQRFLEDLAPAEVHVVFTARSFVHQLPAAWQERLKLGVAHTFDEFLASLDDEDGRWTWAALDPAIALPRWVDPLPVDRVHMVTVPPHGQDRDLLWKRLAAVLDIEASAYDTTRTDPNQSLGAETARLLQRLGPTLRSAIDADNAKWTEQYRWLRRYIGHQLLVPRGGTRIRVSDAHLTALHSRALRTVEAIKSAGYQVEGDLDDLLAADVPAGSRTPESVTDTEQLEAAIELIGDLLRDVRRQTLRAEEAERSPAENGSDVD
jgi:hypothetical protein